jgi:hypothetical protein
MVGLTTAWLSTLAGCNGCSGLIATPPKCKTGDCCHTDADCVNLKKQEKDPDPSNWFCKTTIETCLPIQKECQDDGQCCPGQTCSPEAGVCIDSYVPCTDNSGCNTSAAQYCDMTLGSYPQGPGCTYQTCNPANGNADCGAGLSCFNSYCLNGPPCNGGCPSGSVCTPVNNFCFKLDNPSKSCGQTCATGYILVFQDGANVFNMCDPAGKQDCTCEALPPIQSSNTSLYSDAVVAGTKILVSAYDYNYGDLVLHTFDKTTLTETGAEWIDGVPADGMITGDPNGARGGNSTPGPDVGRYTSIAYDPTSDTTHIAYYAVTDGATTLADLKYAWRTGTGSWTTVTVDGEASGTKTASVGKYTSITLSPENMPVISYFQEAGQGSSVGVTAIKVARAKVTQPASASDFNVSTIETEGVTPAPCADAPCGSGQVCVQQTGTLAGTCVNQQSASNCTPACNSSTQICGKPSGGSSACYTPQPAPKSDGLPPGDGLFTGIAYVSSLPVVVWYDHGAGRLKGVIAENDSPRQGAHFSPNDVLVLDDGTGMGGPAHDVGRFASIAVGPSNQIAIAYVDETAHQLDLITAGANWSNLSPPGSGRIVDSGVGMPMSDPILSVGSDTSVKFAGGLISVVYQDQTAGNFRIAQQSSASSPVAFKSVLAADGACGFYGRLAVDPSGMTLYASHAIVKANSATQSGNKLAVLAVP